MEHCNKEYCLEVAGDYACFTRPEMKVERVSYDVITPSAARAIFEAIFWKPAIRWRPMRIEVLNPIRWSSVRRNEVGSVMSDRSDCIFIEEARQQRAGLILQDVAYRLHAELEFIPVGKRAKSSHPLPEHLSQDKAEQQFAKECAEAERAGKDENPGKYNAMFERRARKGQCFNQPYLGCREFSCLFRLVDSPASERAPISETRELGYMLYDLDFSNSDDPKPAFFKARLDSGVVVIPSWASEEVRR